MKEIKLTQGYVAIVDDEDYELINQFNWFPSKSGNIVYAGRRATKNKKRYNIQMHRLIMGLESGCKLIVDHINHNGLDNRKENLRVCTQQLNTRNSRKRKDCHSKHKGVGRKRDSYLSKTTNKITYYPYKWSATIHVNGSNIYLGDFKLEEDAARAYNEAAIKHFGEFALLNKV